MSWIMSKRKNRLALIQYAYGLDHLEMLSTCRSLHATYCAKHHIDYLADNTGLPSGGRPAHWRKVELLIDALAKGYDRVAWLDADCVIVSNTFNIFDASGFGIAVCECFDSPEVEQHLNTGFLLCSNSDEVRLFIEQWNKAPIGGKWEDQSAFNDMMRSRPNRDLLTILPNRFNCLDVHMEARDPFIKAFHGLHEKRSEKVRELVLSLR